MTKFDSRGAHFPRAVVNVSESNLVGMSPVKGSADEIVVDSCANGASVGLEGQVY